MAEYNINLVSWCVHDNKYLHDQKCVRLINALPIDLLRLLSKPRNMSCSYITIKKITFDAI